MAILKEEDIRHQSVKDVAAKMMIAARTAPKAKGRDNLEIIMIDGDDMKRMGAKMSEIAAREDFPSFERDGGNLEKAEVMVLIGTKIQAGGIKFCGLCGFGDCAGKNEHPDTPCVFNTGDLGIAIGSAVATASDLRVDNRIMYTAGMAALELGIFSPEVKICYGIPLSSTGKSPFFDRK